MHPVLKALYPYFPVVLQNLGISAYGYLYRRERFGPAFEPTLTAFIERETWTKERMNDYLVARLREVLQAAYRAPHYQAAWAEAGVDAGQLSKITLDSLRRLPILKKQSLRADPMAFVPPDRRAGRLLTYHSSGSTGTPIKAICTAPDQQRFAAAREARSYRWAGTSIRRPRAMIGGQPIVTRALSRGPFYRYNLAERQVYFSAYHLSPANIDDYVAGFNRYRPELVTGYAFSQFLLARNMLERGLHFDCAPKAALTSSEPLTDAMKDVIARAWGCRAYQEYGSVENAALATECERERLHVSPDFGIVELLDAHDRPVPPGVEGRIICTALLNDAQFLVRYEIGDTAVWSTDACPCGRDHLPVLERITGRIEDVVVGPDGREMVRFHGIFVDLPHVLEGQVIQEALDRFLVRVITEPEFGSHQIEEISRRFHARLGPVTVRVHQVTELERTPSGKLRAVISLLGRQHVSGATPPATSG